MTEAADSPLAAVVQGRSMRTTVGLVCDVRLGLLFACEVGLILTGSSPRIMVVLLAAMVMGWVPLYLLRRWPETLGQGWWFPCADLLVTVLTVLLLSGAFENAFHLVVPYVLASALLVGIVLRAVQAAVWTSGVVSALALVRTGQEELSSVVLVASVLGVAACVLLGDRLRTQVREASRLSAEVAATRAEERALAERLTIARDLHDSLAKSVHGIRMLAESLHDSLASENHHDVGLSRVLLDSADEASREARLVLDGLRASGEDDVVGALTQEVVRWSERTGIEVTCRRGQAPPRVACRAEAMWQIQRVLGEVLANTEKHAQAQCVDFCAWVEDGALHLEVSDDGVGLGGQDLTTPPSGGHYGVAGMRERAGQLGARLTIESQPEPGVGVRTRMSVPMTALTESGGRQV
ncbi:sensor histidine kinase [Actinomyces lilanjuaniae]|uniref:sensor histidine kinase n=1 Tax=Actinomyces lilanjuaniae TaxID=2321394 RepID=UPI001FAAD41A|nr:ATP-binding protein [Actinomyces lilanjuaniae]